MRLIDDLAASHLLYVRPIPTLSDVMVLDVRARYASASLPLGRYYPIVVETADEACELMAYLREDRPQMIVSDLFDHRPSALETKEILFCRYKPPVAGWPWLLLCCWPKVFAQMASSARDNFARSSCTSELFRTPHELEDMQLKLLAHLGSDYAVGVRFIAGGSVGNA